MSQKKVSATISVTAVIDGQDGQDGVSITSANVFYALSNQGPTGTPPADAAFTYDDFPNGNLTPGYYVWQATVVTFSNGNNEVTGKMCLGATTDFLEGVEVYATSQSGTNPPDDGTTNWKTTYTRQKGYYLWTATRVTYTNGTVSYMNKKCVGYWGEDGVSITSANVYYALSTAGPKGTPPADTAFTYDDFPNGNLTPDMYVWQATKVTFSNGNSEVTGKMCLGATTDFLQGTEVYATSQSGTNPPDDGPTNWKTTYTRQKGYYLWTATRVTYTNGTVAYMNKKCVGYWGEDGVSITSANVYYALSTADPTGTPPADEAFTYDDFPNGNLQPGYYVWQATKVEYSEGEPQFTGKMCLGATTDFLQGAEVYAVSQSGTTVPQTWATSYTIRNGYYLWTATKVTYTNGHVGYLNPKCVGYWGEDGTPTPYYFEETFAWSNQPSTDSSTTPPNDISSTDWRTSIPAQGTKKYLWRKSIRHVWNTSSKSYDAEAAQYFRMSGLDGTGIDIKGAVERYSHMEADGHVTPEGGSRRQAANGDCYVLHEHYSGSDGNDKYGHLFQWNTEAGTWVDIGQFQGQPGVTYYTHVAWATSVTVNSSGQATSVQGFITTKSPNDTAHDWMGVYVDTNSGQDSNNALHYTWTYTKGQQGDPGDDAVVYSVQCSPAAVNFRSNAVGEFYGSYTVGCKVMKTVGNNTTEVAASSGTYDGMYLKCRKLNTSGNYTSWDAASSTTLTPSDALTNNYVAVEFALSANSGMTAIKARASVPIMCDGHRGAPGEPGGAGATGRMFRPRGTYNSSATYVRDNDFVDLVFFDDRVNNNANGARGHYYYISDGYSSNVSDSTHYAPAPKDGDGNTYPYSEGVWSIASDFGVVITQAIFAEFAKMGSAIITGDWMLSQHGTADGVFYDSHKVLVAFMVGSNQKTSIHPYTLFNGSSPTGGLVSVSTHNTTISRTETSHNIISARVLKPGLCYKITCRVPDGYTFSGVPVQIQIDKASTYDPITLLTVSEEETVYTTYVMVPVKTTYRLRLVRSSTASQDDTISTVIQDDTISTVIEQVTFGPQYAVDLLTGLTYMVDAYVKGDVIRPVLTMTQDNSAQYVIYDSAAPATGGNLFFVDLPRAFRTVQITMIQDGNGNLPPGGVVYILLPEVMPQDVGVEMTVLNATRTGSGALTMYVRSGDSNPKAGGYGSLNRWLLNGIFDGNINAYPVANGGDLRVIELAPQDELRLRAVQLPSANNVNTGSRGWIALGQPYNICEE